MKINFKKLSDTAIAPNKSHYNDSGFDLYADEDVTLAYGETKAVATNIALELPDGYMADVRPRSGLTRDTALRVHYGTVDAGYRGSIGIICENANYKEDFECIELSQNMAKAETTLGFLQKGKIAIEKWHSIIFLILMSAYLTLPSVVLMLVLVCSAISLKLNPSKNLSLMTSC